MGRAWPVLVVFFAGCYPWVDASQFEKDNPDCIWYADADGDGFGDGSTVSSTECTKPRGGVSDSTDCDDEDGATFPDATEICDGIVNDCNMPAITPDEERDRDGDRYVACVIPEGVRWKGAAIDGGGDCVDDDSAIHPAALERCDDADNNCNGRIDEGGPFDHDGDGHTDPDCDGDGDDCDDDDGSVWRQADWYPDKDEDGFGTGAPQSACGAPGSQWAPRPGDCEDTDAAINPDQPETCGDGVDNDCSGRVDDRDGDKDGAVDEACGGGDCDDANALIHPNRLEDCTTLNIDDDCSGFAEDRDADFDGFVDAELCGGTDCDDATLTINPNAIESCETVGIDDNCDGLVDDRDIDGDGQVDEACGGIDCNDLDPYIFDRATEAPDGVDNNCDGVADEGTILYDDDGDGYCEALSCTWGPLGGGDCDDDDSDLSPDAADVCDGIDNDCTLSTDELADGDGDGYSACDGDCDDLEPLRSPQAREVCGNGIDDDCDGTIDTACVQCDAVVPVGGSIQTAIDGAADGDVLCVEPGVFNEMLDWGARDATLIGLFGPTQTTVSGGLQPGPTLRIAGAAAVAVVDGFTFSTANNSVAGVEISGQATATLRNTHISDNYSDGVAVLDANTTATLSNVSVYQNFAGITGDAGGTLIVRDSAIFSNVGRGISINNQVTNNVGSVSLDNVSVSGHADTGVYIAGTSGTPLPIAISNATVTDNEFSGLVIALVTGVVQNVLVQGNSSPPGGYGAGISAANATLEIRDSIIRDNVSTLFGGGIEAIDPIRLVNVDVLDNRSGRDGGGIWGQFDAEGLHLEGNTADGDGGGAWCSNCVLKDVVAVDNLAVDGGSALWLDGTTTIENLDARQHLSDLMHVASGADVSVAGLVLRDNRGSRFAIENEGILVLDNATIMENDYALGALISSGPTSMLSLQHVFMDPDGTGLVVEEGSATLSHTVIAKGGTGGTTGVDVGAVWVRGGNVSITNSAILGNEGAYSGGVFVGTAGVVDVNNSVFARNRKGSLNGGAAIRAFAGGAFTVANSAFWENWLYDFTVAHTDDDATLLVNQHVADPAFLDISAPDPIDWDLHLSSTGGSLDKGDPAILDPDGSPSDFGVYGGPQATGWDLDGDGYFEWWPPGPYDSVNYPGLGWDCDDQHPDVFPGQGC